MRAAVPILLAGLLVPLALVTGCPGEAPPPRLSVAPPPPRVEAPRRAPQSYWIADPDTLPKGRAIALDGGALGVLTAGSRVVVRDDQLRVAVGSTAEEMLAVQSVPAWLGGGFLFRTSDALYASDAFDGALRPVAALPVGVLDVTFTPRGVLARGRDGHRRLVDLRSGADLPMEPLGLADVLTLADGRAAALVEGGHLLVSTDRGAHWSDATSSCGGAPTSLLARAGEIWILTDTFRYLRLDPGGVLRDQGGAPDEVPERLRPMDPAWHGGESPLAAAIRRGAKLDDRTAILVEAGDVMRVDLRTGAVTVIAPGRIPSNLSCDTLRLGDEIVAVCAEPEKPSIVVTHLAEGHPSIERTLPVEGPYFADADGTLGFGGSCDGAGPSSAVCLRDPHGAWHEFRADASPDVDGGPSVRTHAGADAGDAAPDPRAIVRWVSRDGGHPLAILGGKAPGTFDPETRAVHLWRKRDDEKAFPSDILAALEWDCEGDLLPGGIVDRRWSMSDGVLRGSLDTGQFVKIGPSGVVERSAFVFSQAATVDAYGFAIDSGGRAYQTTDHGGAWTEVAPPPVARLKKSDMIGGCSAIGCELGDWFRLGWDDSPPKEARDPPSIVPPPTRAASVPLRELACTSAGPERLAQVARNPAHPDAVGLGARTLPVDGKVHGHETFYYRRFVSRAVVNPAHGEVPVGVLDRAPRAIVQGWCAEFTAPTDASSPESGITVFGPRRGAADFRRDVTFFEPFDPEAAMRTASFGLRDFDVATRFLGTPLARVFEPFGPQIDAIATIVPLDPAGTPGFVFSMPSDAGRVLGTVAGGPHPRLMIAGLRADPFHLTPTSAVEIGASDLAVLVIGADRTEEVVRLGATGVSSMHHGPPAFDAPLAPANADALAVGPQGALAILRTPSGSEPPSDRDPALLLPLGGGSPIALAPWSTLTSADDAACRGDLSGYRAIVQPALPWLRVRDSRRMPDGAPPTGAMLARVRWGAHRVCLEAVEVPDGGELLPNGTELETAVVARFTGKTSVAARVGVTAGAELREPLACTLTPP